jgi:serine phosphatase RsbU (regulator of sigma subunit)
MTTVDIRGAVRYGLALVVVAGAYFASGKLGLDLAFATNSVTAIWPPTGIALAALILGGNRLWPAVTAGALLTNLDTGVPAGTVLGITVGNTLEALVGASLLRRVGFRPALSRVVDVFALVALAAVVSTLVSATIGVGSLLAGSEIDLDDAPTVWRTWWLGDMGGDLIVAPAILVLAATGRRLSRLPGRLLEAAGLAAALTAVGVVVFSQRTSLVYVIFPLLTWAALRFWQPGATLASLVTAIIAVAFTANDEGPFAPYGPDERLLLAQTFVGVAGMTALILAAVTTERQRVQQTMSDIAGTLQESLLPTPLPELPHLASATYFRPAGEGQRVGGDFYDMFEGSDGNWVFVVGDVCGKGPRAAALTALARYTLREAAAHEKVPSRVLRLLHRAVRRQSDDTEFCTALYVRLDIDGSNPSLTLASGGHPLPLVLRAGGGVEELGRPGTLLGAYPDPTLTDQQTELRGGDTVFFYTDGLLDAFAPERIVEVAELAEVLRWCTGLSPGEVIAAVERAVLGASEDEPRDDVAMVVLQVV